MPMSPTAVRAVFAHLLGLALLGLATLAQAAPQVASVESPGKVLKVSLVLDGGAARYRVERFGETVVEDSKLGFALRDGRLDRDFALLGQQQRSVDDRWEQPWGERRITRNRFNELTVQLAETTGSKRRLDVVFRVYDDGVGFRYVFPEQPNLHEAIIDDELTEFAIAQDSTAWWIPAGDSRRLVDPCRQPDPLRVPVPAHAAARGSAGAYTDDPAQPRRPARGDP